MDPKTALQYLAELTGSLQPSVSAGPEELRAARYAIAQSLFIDQGAVIAVSAQSADRLPVEQLTPELRSQLEAISSEAAITSGTAAPAQVRTAVVRRDLPVVTPLRPSSVPAQLAGMKVERTFGPFLGNGGRPYWFDLYPIVSQVTVTRSPEAAFFLSLPLETVRSRPGRYRLGAGSIWFRSQLVAASAPAGSWTGLNISGGSLTLSAPSTLAASNLEIAANTVVTLTLQLEFNSSQSGGSGPGGDARAVVANLPAAVTLVFGTSGAQVTAVSDALLTVYGISVGLHWSGGAPEFEAALQQILVPFVSSVTSFSPHSAVSDLLSLSGTAPVSKAGWGLPVAAANPAALGQAAGAGDLVLLLEGGLAATCQGTNGGGATLVAAWLICAAGEIVLLAEAANSRLTQEFLLWQETARSTRRSSIDVLYPQPFVLLYFSISSAGTVQSTEALLTTGSVQAHIDRPVAADGSRLGPRFTGLVVLFEDASHSELLIEATVPASSSTPPPMALALHNALLVTTPPQGMLVVGILAAGNSINRGGLLLSFGLYELLPILPDPYAANFYPIAAARGNFAPGIGAFSNVPVVVAQGATTVLDVVVTWTAPASAALSFLQPSIEGLSERITVFPPTPDPFVSSTDPIAVEDQQRLAGLREIFDETLGISSESLLLLDVSSNAGQFGVGFGAARSRDDAKTQNPFSITDLDLVTPGVNIRSFTVPQIQWEPVINIPNPDGPFPTPLSTSPAPVGFWDDGGPTLLGSPTVTLVPIAPIPVLNQIVSSYQAGSTAAALFTLPFGMKAVAKLPAPVHTFPIPTARPSMSFNQPSFTPQNLTGSLQVNLSAARPLFGLPNSPSPTLPGATVQLRNLINPSGLAPFDLSILGANVDPTFNTQFNPGQPGASVPVTRIDLSGYGASMFSNWVDPSANPPAVIQARFDVMVGRTAYEIVKIKSILYPWGAVVVRTITIQRVDNAEVLRWDSGWVAATPGIFDLPFITVHPGEVRGMYNIRNIRDTSQAYTGPDGVGLRAVYFDADSQIDDAVSGVRNGLVPTSGQFGFVLVQPLLIGVPLTAQELADLLTSQGPLGGPVDCVLNVGSSGQQMRVVRVEVANAPTSGGNPQFAAVVRGTVVLPRQGTWSIVQRTDAVSEPQPIDPDLGVPLIRQGEATMSGTNTNPYRFAEAVDLWSQDSPSVDYCFMQTTMAARILFPRPKIETGTAQISSTVIPLLADAYAMLNAAGLCPPQTDCIPFPNSNYSLQVAGPGLFTLNVSPNPFTISQPTRSLAASAGMAVALEYADEDGNPSQVNVAIAPTSWSISVGDTSTRLDIDPFPGLLRSVGTMQSTNTTAPCFPTSRVAFSGVLSPVQSFISFMEALGLPNPLNVTVSNAIHKTKLNAALQLQLPFTGIPPIPTDTPLGSIKVNLKLGVGNVVTTNTALSTTTSQWSLSFAFSGSLSVAVFPPIKVGGMIGLGIGAVFPSGKTPGVATITFQAGVVLSVGGDLIPGVLSLEASVTYAYEFVFKPTTPLAIGIGVALTLAVSGKVLGGLIGIGFTADAIAILFLQPSPCALIAQATFDASVDVTVCWFMNFSMSVTAQYSQTIACP